VPRQKKLDTSRLPYTRAQLLLRMDRYEAELKHVHWVFLLGAGSSLLGTWLLVQGPAPSTISGDVVFNAGILLALFGIISLGGSMYVRIFYPTRLRRLEEDLRRVDDFLRFQHAFPENVREQIGGDLRSVYEAQNRETARWFNTLAFLSTYRLPMGLLGTALGAAALGVLRGAALGETLVLCGPLFAAGALLAGYRYRRGRQREQAASEPAR
jgi:hypothetical protein